MGFSVKQIKSNIPKKDAATRQSDQETSLSPSNKRNWVNEVLDNAVRVYEAWPDWMKRPELQTPEYPSKERR